MSSFSINRHISPQINVAQIRSKHERLMSAAPASTFDCSALYHPQMLSSALEHAASSPAGNALTVACALLFSFHLTSAVGYPFFHCNAHCVSLSAHSYCGEENRRVVESTISHPHSSSYTAAAAVRDAG
jgi:hypothetical protein